MTPRHRDPTVKHNFLEWGREQENNWSILHRKSTVDAPSSSQPALAFEDFRNVLKTKEMWVLMFGRVPGTVPGGLSTGPSPSVFTHFKSSS